LHLAFSFSSAGRFRRLEPLDVRAGAIRTIRALRAAGARLYRLIAECVT
jgi:hypothetical protein